MYSKHTTFLSLLLFFAVIFFSTSIRADEEDLGWPREIDTEKFRIVMYQPQLESFEDNIIRSRSAVSVTNKDSITPVFGVVWMDAKVAVDRDERLVSVLDLKITDVNFPNSTDEQEKALASFLEKEIPQWNLTISLDRILVGLEMAEKESDVSENLKHDPPNIIFTTEPSILISIDGDPIMQDIENSNLQVVVNCPFFLIQEKSSKNYFLYGGAVWYTTKNIKGNWQLTKSPPKEAVEIIEQNMKEAGEEIKNLEIPDEDAAVIVVATEPTELISTDGDPSFSPISETDLLYVENSENDIFLNIDSQEYFILISGRWYKSTSLDGGWSFVESSDLPSTFQNIPPDSPKGGVRSSIAGTEEALDAVMDSYIPQTSAVDRNDKSLNVEYDGDPEWEQIEETDLQYAVNTQYSVIEYEGIYYCCHEAVWYQSNDALGPWEVCVDVPDEIYKMPPSSPVYNVKYVYVYESTPEVVYVGYTPGYTYSYIYGGCVVYGTGWYYSPWYRYYYYPRAVTWGFGVHYNPYTGWSFSFGIRFGGPNLWVGVGWYRPYYRGWWGPAGYRAGYRHGYRAGYYAGRRSAYRDVYRTQQRRDNIYNKNENRKRNVERTVQRDRKNTDFSTRNKNNVYADRNGNVHRKTDQGWEKRDKSGWTKDNTRTQQERMNNLDKNKSTKNKTIDKSSSLNREYNNRQRSNQRHNNAPKQRSGTRTGGRRR